MAFSYDDFYDQYGQRGLISKVGLAVFVGLPATMALAAALAVYCTFQIVTDSLFPRPKGLKLSYGPAPAQKEEAFTASLSKMAEVHGPAGLMMEVQKQHEPETASSSKPK